jgi:hypothetical protein
MAMDVTTIGGSLAVLLDSIEFDRASMARESHWRLQANDRSL